MCAHTYIGESVCEIVCLCRSDIESEVDATFLSFDSRRTFACWYFTWGYHEVLSELLTHTRTYTLSFTLTINSYCFSTHSTYVWPLTDPWPPNCCSDQILGSSLSLSSTSSLTEWPKLSYPIKCSSINQLKVNTSSCWCMVGLLKKSHHSMIK